MKKFLKASLSIILVLFITLQISPMQIFASSPTADSKQQAETSELCEQFTLDDLPQVVKDTVYNGEKTPAFVTDISSEDLYALNVRNQDESNSLFIFGQAIKYKDEDGKIKIKKNKLQKSDKKVGLLEKYVFESTNNNIKGYFPNKTDKGIKVEYNDYSIVFSPILTDKKLNAFAESDSAVIKSEISEGANTEEVSVTDNIISSTAKTAITETTVADTSEVREIASESAVYSDEKDGKLVYDKIFSENTALEYMPVLNGIKENIILKQYEGINEFQFIIDTDGLVPAALSGASINLLNPETQNVEMCIGQVDAKDSFTGENVNDDVHYTLENSLVLQPTNKKSEYILTVIVDKAFLESKTTVYPVTIDPTIYIDENPIFDCPVYSGNTSLNDRTNPVNRVGYINSSLKTAISYFKVNCMQNYYYIDPGKITAAYLNSYENSGNTSQVYIQVHDTNATWDNSTICWSNRPGTTNFDTSASLLLRESNKTYSFNITGLLKKWLGYERAEGGWTQQYGFALVPAVDTNVFRSFGSANNSSNPPSIVIYYNDLRTIPDGMYFIRSLNSGKYLDRDTGSTNVQQWSFGGTVNQAWYASYQGNGYYKLYNYWNGETKCLDNETSSCDNGANVDVWNDNNGDWLYWQINSNGDGTYRIKNKYTGNKKCLDITDQSTSNGANAQLWDYFGNDNQKWCFENVASDQYSYSNTSQPFAQSSGILWAYDFGGQLKTWFSFSLAQSAVENINTRNNSGTDEYITIDVRNLKNSSGNERLSATYVTIDTVTNFKPDIEDGSGYIWPFNGAEHDGNNEESEIVIFDDVTTGKYLVTTYWNDLRTGGSYDNGSLRSYFSISKDDNIPFTDEYNPISGTYTSILADVPYNNY